MQNLTAAGAGGAELPVSSRHQAPFTPIYFASSCSQMLKPLFSDEFSLGRARAFCICCWEWLRPHRAAVHPGGICELPTGFAVRLHVGELQTRLTHGSIILWFRYSMVLSFCGPMILWFYGSVIPWFWDSIILWFYGFMILWIYGSMVLWFDHNVVLYFYGSIVLWFYGSMSHWFRDSMVLRFCGSVVL